MVRAVQVVLWRDAHELIFDLGGRLAVGEARAVRDAEDVRVHSDRAFAENFHQHHVRGLAANPRQGFQRFTIARHLAIVLIDKRL